VFSRSRGLLMDLWGRWTARRCKRLIGRASLVGLLATFVSDCGGGDQSSAPEGRKAGLAAVIQVLDNPFFAAMRDGLVATARQHKVRITVEAALELEDTAGQASELESLAAKHRGCYIVNPIDQTNLLEALATVAPGTPIVNIDSPVDRRAASAEGVSITTYIGTNNIAAGHLAADGVARLVPRSARVAVVTGISGDAGSTARAKGFTAGARGRFNVVATVSADFDRDQARSAAAKLLRSPTPVDGFFAVNDQMALGVSEAVRALGKTGQVAVVGMDGIPEALTAVVRGGLSATVAQYPYTIGQLGDEACLAAIRGKPLPPRVDAPIQLVTGSNAARALANRPRPVEPFADPLIGLLHG
jgi:ABC-type sugar transport system substrate-binding protein